MKTVSTYVFGILKCAKILTNRAEDALPGMMTDRDKRDAEFLPL